MVLDEDDVPGIKSLYEFTAQILQDLQPTSVCGMTWYSYVCATTPYAIVGVG